MAGRSPSMCMRPCGLTDKRQQHSMTCLNLSGRKRRQIVRLSGSTADCYRLRPPSVNSVAEPLRHTNRSGTKSSLIERAHSGEFDRQSGQFLGKRESGEVRTNRIVLGLLFFGKSGFGEFCGLREWRIQQKLRPRTSAPCWYSKLGDSNGVARRSRNLLTLPREFPINTKTAETWQQLPVVQTRPSEVMIGV